MTDIDSEIVKYQLIQFHILGVSLQCIPCWHLAWNWKSIDVNFMVLTKREYRCEFYGTKRESGHVRLMHCVENFYLELPVMATDETKTVKACRTCGHRSDNGSNGNCLSKKSHYAWKRDTKETTHSFEHCSLHIRTEKKPTVLFINTVTALLFLLFYSSCFDHLFMRNTI